MSSRLKEIELGHNSNVQLKIKTSDGSGEIDIEIGLQENVATLKGIISGKMTVGRDKYLRLIYNGKLLDPPEAILSSFKLTDNSYIHAVVSKKPTVSNNLTQTNNTPTATPVPAPVDHRGLNVLLLATGRNGRPMLNTNEIAALRAAFRESIQEFAAYHQITIRPNESPQDFTYRCEAQWMYSQDATSEFQQNLMAYRLFGNNSNGNNGRGGNATNTAIRGGVLNGGEEGESFIGDHDDDDEEQEEEDIEEGGNGQGGTAAGGAGAPYSFAAELQAQAVNNSGTTKDFMMGLFIGYFLGVLAMFCMRGNMSTKQRIGICVGVLLQGFTNAFFNPRIAKGSNSDPSGAHGGLRGSGGDGATLAPHGNANDDAVGVVKSIPG